MYITGVSSGLCGTSTGWASRSMEEQRAWRSPTVFWFVEEGHWPLAGIWDLKQTKNSDSAADLPLWSAVSVGMMV